MRCVLCDNSLSAFGFHTQDTDKNICLVCFESIRNLKHYAPYPIETGE